MTSVLWGQLAAIIVLVAACLWLGLRLRARTRELSLQLRQHQDSLRKSQEALHQSRQQLAQLQTERDQQQARMEAAEHAVTEANRTKSLFIANMSHELRTPLNGILGLAGSLLDSSLSSRQQAEVQLIQLAGDDLIRIVNDILDLSKLDASKVTLEQIPFHLGELLEGVFSLLYPQAAKKHLSYALSYSPAMGLRYLGDPFRIRQVVLNLLSNAIKFTPSGYVFLDAQEVPGSDGAPVVYLHFHDSGIGISPEKQRLIFEEFQQADLSTTRRFGGTGLGLSLSRRVVELMGGAIELESEPDHGSRFTVSLPLQPIIPLGDQTAEAALSPLNPFEGIQLCVQQRRRTETLAILRQLADIPGLQITHFDQASELPTLLQSPNAMECNAILTTASALQVWDQPTLDWLETLGAIRPPLLILRDHPAQPATLPRNPSLETLEIDLPVLPSQLFALLRRLRKAPLGPLFEAAGMTIQDLYPSGAPASRLRTRMLVLAHDNPVELMRLEGLARKLGMDARSAQSTRELSQLLESERPDAAIVQASLLTTEAQVAIWRTAGQDLPPLRLVVTGALDAATRAQLSASPVVFHTLTESPRLAQVKAAIASGSPRLPGAPQDMDDPESVDV